MSTVQPQPGSDAVPPLAGLFQGRARILASLWAGTVLLALLTLVLVVGHYAWTGELLGFLPAAWRSALEAHLNIAPPPNGEGRSWQLHCRGAVPIAVWWLAVVGMTALVAWSYATELGRMSWRVRMVLAMGRLIAFSIVVGLLLPEWVLTIQNYGYPTLVLAVDESQSMQALDQKHDPVNLARQEAVQRQLVGDENLLGQLLGNRSTKVQLFALGDTARLVGTFTPEDEEAGRKAIAALRARVPVSRLGSNLRQILAESRPTAVVVWTDGVVTEGDSLRHAATFAKARGVPLFMVGVGQAEPPRQVRLHDLQVSESVYVHDTLVFEARLTAEGYPEKTAAFPVQVRLMERGRPQPLVAQTVTVDPRGRPSLLRLQYRPTEPGEKVYLLEVGPEEGAEKTGPSKRVAFVANSLQRQVSVLPVRPLKVLYVEGYPRFEYRQLKTLLERQVDPATGAPVVELAVVLLEADPGFATQDQSARAAFPPAPELARFDLVILGDVSAESLRSQELTNLRDYVRVHGGGMLMIAGPRHGWVSYRSTPLAEILPIEIEDSSRTHELATKREPFVPVVAPLARQHPLWGGLRAEDEWAHLEPLSWSAENYRARPEAEILLVHPLRWLRDAPEHTLEKRQPLLLDWLVGAGRCMFCGFEETWRWRAWDGEPFYERYWMHVLRSLAKSQQTLVTLTLDRDGPYRKGQTLWLRARFPEELRNLPDAERMVSVEHHAVNSQGDVELKTFPLQRVADARGLYELKLEKLQEGAYRFGLSAPPLTPRPSAECQVLGPPGELDQLTLARGELEAAAKASGGKSYLLKDASQLLHDLPEGREVPLGPVREIPLWDHPLLWGLALALLASEWALRRRYGLA